MNKTIPTNLIGKIRHDYLGWANHVTIGNKRIEYWIWDRLAQIPEGALVRIDVEVIDPHPEKTNEAKTDI